MRKLALFTIAAVIIIKHRRRPVPHVSVFDLVGNEHARLIYILCQSKPCNEHIAKLKRYARVVGLMHLAGNRPTIKA